MGIAEALGPLLAEDQTAKRPSVQTLRRSGVATPSHPVAPAAERLAAQTPKRRDVKTAKSSDPDYSKKTLYILTTTMRDAWRKYQDQGGKEESELVEMLLLNYIGGR